jgi:hypothetical protein
MAFIKAYSENKDENNTPSANKRALTFSPHPHQHLLWLVLLIVVILARVMWNLTRF